jgi:oligopeptide/dipeptide ABC transporter ATP-binding protein
VRDVTRHESLATGRSSEPGLRDSPDAQLLRIERLERTFTVRSGGFKKPLSLRAVDGVSFDIARGETLGLVGESGCGKSTIARCVLRLTEPTGGKILFDGADVARLAPAEMRRVRRRMQFVFQDPFASLDPRMAAQAIVDEPLAIHGLGDRSERRDRASQMLELVGITPSQALRKPNAFSGGQRQRIAIARALVLEPEFVILDEPVTALDVSVQAQVLNLLTDLQERFKLTYLFIVHDLAVAEHFCHRLAVLYLGSIVELADRNALFDTPLHPYTVSLLSAAPLPDPDSRRRRRRIVLRGEVPPLDAPRVGCSFRQRCPVGRDRQVCATTSPPLAEHQPGHWAACHFPAELSLRSAE